MPFPCLPTPESADLRWLETVADEVEVVPGQPIVARGEWLRAILLPADPGALVLCGAPPRPASVGHIVGGAAVVSHRQQTTDVVASEPLRLWLIPVAQFGLLRERFPGVDPAVLDEGSGLASWAAFSQEAWGYPVR